jgi:hypothetical protein
MRTTELQTFCRIHGVRPTWCGRPTRSLAQARDEFPLALVGIVLALWVTMIMVALAPWKPLVHRVSALTGVTPLNADGVLAWGTFFVVMGLMTWARIAYWRRVTANTAYALAPGVAMIYSCGRVTLVDLSRLAEIEVLVDQADRGTVRLGAHAFRHVRHARHVLATAWRSKHQGARPADQRALGAMDGVFDHDRLLAAGAHGDDRDRHLQDPGDALEVGLGVGG